ncbi:MAG: site-specific integrase [Pseudomonadota bacterium]|nr:site-specific integrase [Pseudomonadota bacterium]MDQ6867246.1 site-specific integrase [Pseudomonadota bacterium]
MPKRVAPLNAKQIEKWRPNPSRILELVDGAVPGLRVRLTPNGTMTWSLSARVNGERRRLNLGEGLGLAEARRKAEDTRRQIADGVDPTEAKTAARDRRKAAVEGHGTLGSVIAAYFEAGPGKDLRSGAAARAVIEVVFAEHLSHPSLDVRPGQLQIAADTWRSQSTAARAVAFFRPLAAWSHKRELVVKGFDDLEMPALAQDGEEIGQHVLSSEEVGRLLRALDWRGHDGAARFMLLTAARREEIVGAVWAEIDLEKGIWTIPACRRKDTRAPSRRRRRAAADHLVPLSRQAKALLEALGPGNPADFVFVGGRGAKLTNWPRWSAQLEKEIGVASVTPHALRRTAATLAGDLGCAPHVISALLGHRAIGGSLIAGYNKSRFMPEVADILQQLGGLLTSLEAGQDNVVVMRRA